MIHDTLIPVWVPFTAECIATVATLIALVVYAALFPWTESSIGRHRFALYLSVFMALALTVAGYITGYYRGSFLVSTVVLLGITAVMVWAVVQMLDPPKREKQKKEQLDEDA